MDRLEYHEIDKVIGDNLEPKTSEEVLKGQPKGFETNDGKDDWYGREVSTQPDEGVQMVDAGVGGNKILRMFEFGINPEVDAKLKKDKVSADKQMIFNSHWPQIRTLLWGDGLVANEDVAPRVVLGQNSYKIFMLCEPKLRTMVAEKAQTLQDIFKPKKTA